MRDGAEEQDQVEEKVGEGDSGTMHGLSGRTVFNRRFFMSVRFTSHCACNTVSAIVQLFKIKRVGVKNGYRS